MSRTYVTAPGLPTTLFIYCDRCRSGEPFQTRKAGWRLNPDSCPTCPAPVVRLRPNPCEFCGADMMPGRRVYRVSVGYAGQEAGDVGDVEEADACSKRCAHDLLKSFKRPVKIK